MFTIEAWDAEQVEQLLKDYPLIATRAAEIALDKTVVNIRDEIKDEIVAVFNAPVRWTRNSLRITPTRNHNLEASVWFKDPERMGEHYLVPQVEGGVRQLKGFERGLGGTMFIPGVGAKKDKHDNVSVGQIKQVLSVLGKAETSAGFSANKTARSARRNGRQRDFFYLRARRGKLYPGVYERTALDGAELTAKDKRKRNLSARDQERVKDRSKAWQRGRWGKVVRGRGVKPILIKGHQHTPVVPRLHFYEIAQMVYDHRYAFYFDYEFNKGLRKYNIEP